MDQSIAEAILDSRVHTSADVPEVFRLLFSSLRQPDEHLPPVLANKTQDQQITFIIKDILSLAENGRRDAHYGKVDGYYDASYKNYLNTKFIPLEPMFPGQPLREDDPAATSGIINSYLKYAFPRDPAKRNEARVFLYNLLQGQKGLLVTYNRLKEYVGVF